MSGGAARRPDRAGFTLVEMVVAVALAGLLFTALNAFLFSMAELWGGQRERRVFEQHVRAATRHLEGMLARAAMPGSADPEYGPGITTGAVWRRAGLGEAMLTFRLPEGDRLLEWPERPLPDVVCAIAAPASAGLVLYFQSRLELDFGAGRPRAQVVSPLVEAVRYEYFDPAFGTWRSSATPVVRADGSTRVPDRLRLQFRAGPLAAEGVVRVPDMAGGEGPPA